MKKRVLLGFLFAVCTFAAVLLGGCANYEALTGGRNSAKEIQYKNEK